MERPSYLALNHQGSEYERPATVIEELPEEARAEALREATQAIASITGLSAFRPIPFGAPVFTAYAGINRPLAKHRSDASLLLTLGCRLSLDLCPTYN